MKVLSTALTIIFLYSVPASAQGKITCYETSCQSPETNLMDFNRDGEIDAVFDVRKKDYIVFGKASGNKGYRYAPEEKEKFQRMFELMKATAQKISLDNGDFYCEYEDSENLVGTPTVTCADGREENIGAAWKVKYPFQRVHNAGMNVYKSEEDKRINIEGTWVDPLFYIDTEDKEWVIRDGNYGKVRTEPISEGSLEQAVRNMIRELEDRTGTIFIPKGYLILKK